MSARSFAVIVLSSLVAWGCGSSGGGKDPGQDAADVQTDVPDVPDTSPPDEAEPDIPDVPDVPDTPPPPVDTYQPYCPDVVFGADVKLYDVVWDQVPTLIQGVGYKKPYAAGAARRVINPSTPQFMGGFGFCPGNEAACRKTEGVHDDMSASVAVIADTKNGEVVAFVGVDDVGLIKFDIDEIHVMAQMEMWSHYGMWLDGPRVVVTASHAHSTPDTTGMFGPLGCKPRDEQYMTFMKAKIVEAVVEAWAALEDADLDWGHTTVPNQDDDKEHDDMDLYVLRGRDSTGKTIFTLTRWPSHPTAYGSGNNAVSADWPGVFRHEIEAQLGGIAVYMNGTAGSCYVVKPDPCEGGDTFPGGWQDPDVGPDQHQKATCVGKAVALAAIDALGKGKPLADTGIRFRHSEFAFHPTNKAMLIIADLAPMPVEHVDTDDPASMMHSAFSWVRVGDLDYLTTPGESFASFGFEAKQVLAAAGAANPVIIGLGQDWMGYLLLPKQWEDTDLSYHQGLSPGPEVAPRFLEKLQEVLKGL